MMETCIGLKSFRRLAFAAGAVIAVASTPAGADLITIGQHFQESSNTTSSSPPTAGACNDVSYCYIEFTKVPNGQNLVVRQVSCSLSASAGNVLYMYLGVRRGQNAVERFQFLNSTKNPSSMPGSTVMVNENAYQIFRSGDRPEIYIGYNVAASTTGFCSISGEFISIP